MFHHGESGVGADRDEPPDFRDQEGCSKGQCQGDPVVREPRGVNFGHAEERWDVGAGGATRDQDRVDRSETIAAQCQVQRQFGPGPLETLYQIHGAVIELQWINGRS